MKALIMHGKPVAERYRQRIAAKIAAAAAHNLKTTLFIIIVGDDPASFVYKERLTKQLVALGGKVKELLLPASTSEAEIIAAIKKLNRNRYVTGILPMLPMPKPIDGSRVGSAIAKNKDVDCLNSYNVGEVYAGRSVWAPCTPRACMALLEHYQIELAGKNVVVIGRSNVVGKPLAMLLLQKNATVTICHSRTKNLADVVRQADIVVAAVGIAHFLKAEMIKEGAVLVDVGINELDGKIVGDIDPAAYAKAAAYTPVPGGVGVVSNLMLLESLTRHLGEES